jgi:two-component system, NarL family, nitrate/nitrite response regulator NarL
MNTKRTRVLLAEDHPLYRQGLIAALEQGLPGLHCTGVGSAAEALACLNSNARFDVLIADYQLPDRDGLSLLVEVRRCWPMLGCVLVSGSDDPRVIDKAIALGCLGFVPKSLEPEVMVAVLGRVLAGEAYFPVRDTLAAAPLQFTERQQAVLQRVAQGLTSRAIATELGIGERTVKDHLAVIYGRLDASTRAEAVARAAALNLIVLN